MPTVNMVEAKSKLSQLVDAVESGAEREIVISRNGKPVARIVPVVTSVPKPTGQRIGAGKGRFEPYVPNPELDREVADLLLGKGRQKL